MPNRKTSGIDLLSTNIDPLRAELDGIFVAYPEGAAIAYKFLKISTASHFDVNLDGDIHEFLDAKFILYRDVKRDKDIWRVNRDAVDRFIGGVSDRVKLKCLKNKETNLSIEI